MEATFPHPWIRVVGCTPTTRQLIEKLLKRYGCTVWLYEANPYGFLFDLFHKRISIPDVIFLDLTYPQDAIDDFIRQTKTFEERIAIIGVDAQEDPYRKLSVLRSGFSSYLARPITQKVVRDLIDEYSNH
jgi:CheY-like chemotaxis protein